MDSVPLIMYIMLGILLFLSAFFSSSETAYSSVNKIRLRSYVDEKRKGAKKAYYITENFDEALSTILVGNNIVNIAAATISANIASSLLGGNTGLFVSTFVMTLLVLVFGEILPKSYAKENAENLAMKFSNILFILMKILYPITWFFIKLKNLMSKMVTKGKVQPSVTEEEIKVLVDISEEEGVIDDRERNLVHSALEFDEITVDEVLTPRTNMVAIDIENSIEEIKEIFFENKYSRIPVYEYNNDNIIGILSEREFFSHLLKNQNETSVDIRKLLNEPLFIVGSMKLSSLLPELQIKKIHMAIVVDEFGGTKGLVTLEDVLEELVGEIWDEHDEQIQDIVKINDNIYQFNGNYDVDDFCEFFEIEEPEITSQSLGGWIIEMLERIPEKGEEISYKNIDFVIDKVNDRKIQKIKVIKKEKTIEKVFD